MTAPLRYRIWPKDPAAHLYEVTLTVPEPAASGQVLAMPVRTNTSGDFTALSATDGYVELPREQSYFPVGTPVFLHRW